jgi:hypothetical protein
VLVGNDHFSVVTTALALGKARVTPAYRIKQQRRKRAMSAMGQKETFAPQYFMSALPPTATANADSRKR